MVFPKIKRAKVSTQGWDNMRLRFPLERDKILKEIMQERNSRAVWARALAKEFNGIAACECSVFVQNAIKKVHKALLAVAEEDEK